MIRFILFVGLLTIVMTVTASSQSGKKNAPSGIYRFSMKLIDGQEKNLSVYAGKVLLIVNVASKCGYTPQYKDLEALYQSYKDKGLRILAFPANDFGAQEPGTDSEIQQFCETSYGVTFDLFSKISVKGEDQHPLYTYLTKQSPTPGEVRWNFQKYLIDKNGTVIQMFPSRVKPTDAEFLEKLEALLQ